MATLRAKIESISLERRLFPHWEGPHAGAIGDVRLGRDAHALAGWGIGEAVIAAQPLTLSQTLPSINSKPESSSAKPA